MVELKEFRKVNNLRQKELADYLGVSREYISIAENGKTKLAFSQLGKLRNNPYGWDTSMLSDETQLNAASSVSDCQNSEFEVAALRRENDMLRQQLAELKERCERYWQMIEKLTNKQ